MGERLHQSWRRRAGLAASIRLGYCGLPLALSFLASALVTRVDAVAALPTFWRWVFVVGLSSLVLVLVHRSLAQLLPLAALLEVSVAFPGEAPSRYAVARDAGNVAKLREIVAKAQRGDAVVRADDAQAAREILALVAALRSHDSRTRGHSERVRVFTDLIAQEMDLRPDDRERLRWAALLHDVGKLKIPASVLNKPGRLNESEWAMIRLHPDAGTRLTAPLASWLGDWSRTIADHHEKYDGTGYPRGLAAADISLGGRILAVADAFEVMTAARSYKRPLSREDALRELRRCATTQFDPAVVRAMLAVSTPRLRWAMGPLAWAASTPFALATPAGSTIVMQGGAAVLSVTTVAAVSPLVLSVAPSAHQSTSLTTSGASQHKVTAAAKPKPASSPPRQHQSSPESGARPVRATTGTNIAKPANPSDTAHALQLLKAAIQAATTTSDNGTNTKKPKKAKKAKKVPAVGGSPGRPSR